MPRITELYAYVIADSGPDDEGVPGFSSGQWLMPMMGADRERAEQLREMARGLANQHGREIKLIRSTGIETVEVIRPDLKV